MSTLVKRILLIDDEVDDCNFFKEALYQVDNTVLLLCVQTATGILNITKDYKPDLIFVDLHMPDVNGLQTVTLIKDTYSHLPIIIYSASDNEAQIEEAYRRGAELVLRKSAPFQDLLTGLKIVLQANWADKQEIKQYYGSILNIAAYSGNNR